MAGTMTFRGGHAPLGYDYDRAHKCLVVNDGEAMVVHALFLRYTELRSLRRLEALAPEEGWVSKRTGKPLSRRGIHELLTNPVYLGKYRAGDTVHDGTHPAIIDTELFDEVQALLHASHETAGRYNGNTVEEAWLSDLLRCAHCHGPMRQVFAYHRDGSKDARYRCVERFQHQSHCQDLSSWMVESAVFTRLRDWLQAQPSLPTLAMRAVYGIARRIETLRRHAVQAEHAYDEARLVLESLLAERIATPSQLQHQRDSVEGFICTREMIESEIHRLTVLRLSEAACLQAIQTIAHAKAEAEVDPHQLRALLPMLARQVQVIGSPIFNRTHIEWYDDLTTTATAETKATTSKG